MILRSVVKEVYVPNNRFTNSVAGLNKGGKVE